MTRIEKILKTYRNDQAALNREMNSSGVFTIEDFQFACSQVKIEDDSFVRNELALFIQDYIEDNHDIATLASAKKSLLDALIRLDYKDDVGAILFALSDFSWSEELNSFIYFALHGDAGTRMEFATIFNDAVDNGLSVEQLSLLLAEVLKVKGIKECDIEYYKELQDVIESNLLKTEGGKAEIDKVKRFYSHQ